MAASKTAPAAEFTRNFGRYRLRAQREAVAVSYHGEIAGYFIAADEYEEFKRYRESRRSFATADLSDEKVKASAPRGWTSGTNAFVHHDVDVESHQPLVWDPGFRRDERHI